MLASFLAAFFFALNATFSARNARAHGPARANIGRLIVAALLLGAFAHTLGEHDVMAVAGRNVGARLREADDRTARLQLVE